MSEGKRRTIYDIVPFDDEVDVGAAEVCYSR
jgi:hypothetical protein